MTGTILSFELGLLWPVWMQDFGNVFGLGFTLEGFSFFVEAIFIGIYAYGWDRLRPWAHFASGTCRLLVFADANWAHLVGVGCLVLCAVAAFLLAAPGDV